MRNKGLFKAFYTRPVRFIWAKTKGAKMIETDKTKLQMLEQNNQVLQNKCEEYLGLILRYKKALEKIALQRKIIGSTGYDQDNSVYVDIARAALDLPLDMPEYDDPDLYN